MISPVQEQGIENYQTKVNKLSMDNNGKTLTLYKLLTMLRISHNKVFITKNIQWLDRHCVSM